MFYCSVGHTAGAATVLQATTVLAPVIERPMIIRWISLVPSKMVKILALGEVSAGQRPAEAVVSARVQHRLSGRNDGSRRSAHVADHDPDVLGGYPQTYRILSAVSFAAGTSEVYFRPDLPVPAGQDKPPTAAGRTPGETPEPRAGVRVDTAARRATPSLHW